MVETLLTIKQAMSYCDNVGYVYPTDGESYYINSNVQVTLEAMQTIFQSAENDFRTY